MSDYRSQREQELESWYNNRDLFEMIQLLKSELQETRNAVRQYNNLHKNLKEVYDKVSESCKRLDDIESRQAGRNVVWEGIRNWGGWIVAILSFLYAIGIWKG